MTAKEPCANVRGLADIEGDLAKAEALFADADARLKDAERDRRAAIETIDRRQDELDEAVAKLRRRGAPGSKWRRELGEPEESPGEALILQPDQIAVEPAGLRPAAGRPTLASVSDEFDRLKVLVQKEGSVGGR